MKRDHQVARFQKAETQAPPAPPDLLSPASHHCREGQLALPGPARAVGPLPHLKDAATARAWRGLAGAQGVGMVGPPSGRPGIRVRRGEGAEGIKEWVGGQRQLLLLF